MRGAMALIVLAAGGGTAVAQITPIGPFTGPHTESFETQPAMPDTLYSCLPGRVFNNAADICEPAMSSVVLPTFFSTFCQATPRTGPRYLVALQGPVEITFDAPVTRFGGYFGTAGGIDGAQVTFSDTSGPLGTVAMTTTQCEYTWSGWRSKTPFTRIRIVGNSPFGGGGYVHMDDLEYGTGATCYANCDASTGTPLLTANDFTCFVNAYATGASYANCDSSSGVPTLTANDFLCFLNRFADGCS